MTAFSRIVAVALCLIACAPAGALDCPRAASAIERRLCADRGLADLDRAVSVLYQQVRAMAVGPVRTALLKQQRAWLTERDRLCASADHDCLVRVYTQRHDQLVALDASAEANDGRLEQVAPVMLRGRWRASAPLVPGEALPAAGAELAHQLIFAGLPQVGETVSAAPGKLCIAEQPCEKFGWSVTTVGKLEGGTRLTSDLGLAPDRVAYTGSNGSPRSSLTLVADGKGGLLAILGVCGPAASHCRNATQAWQPLEPGAGFTSEHR